MEHDKVYIDLRKQKRHGLICSVVISDGIHDRFGVIRNISEEGFGIECVNRLYLNSRYTLRFMLPHGGEMKLAGNFVWARPKDNFFTYGARITEIGMLSRMRLKRHFTKYTETQENVN